ncbi:MAG: type IX secretion system outer membrane channel protein PorV [Capnocytophaga sp.]|nr:type IX secretion system outer membrane channel protein PorV [Capnocytophaga sp.]
MRWICILFFLTCYSLFSQEQRSISTAFPFLLLSTDAIASGKGDIGIASKPDVFSQHWNSAKYVFSEHPMKIGMGYTPYLNSLVRDIFLGNISYYWKNNRSAWATSLKYFSIGDVTLTQDFGSETYILGDFRPAEFAFDVSYNLKLSEYFAMGVLARYLRSDLRLPTDEKSVGSGFSFDISGYYKSKEHLLGKYFGKYAFGFQLSNIGKKVKYDDLGKEFFIPTNLKIGSMYSLQTEMLNEFSLLVEFNKLLVPTLSQGNDDVDFLQGIFKSFSDAPNGFSEELQEISWALGFEYVYDKSLFLRTGYFNQHKNKGDRKYITLGAGFAMRSWQLDFSYLIPTTQTENPLRNSLRVCLQYSF